MDWGRNIVVAQTHTLSSVLLFSSITCSWTLHHTRIVVLGFVTHYLVQTPLQSESHVYISRLVKTRDPYPGLLQFAISFPFPFSLPSLLRLILWSLPFIHLYFCLYACLYLVEVLSGLLTRRGPIVITHSVREPSYRLHHHTPCPSRTNT
jgi:hypothetical protein